jgi:hypothetical protein
VTVAIAIGIAIGNVELDRHSGQAAEPVRRAAWSGGGAPVSQRGHPSA